MLDHQTTGLVARKVEEMGIPTLYIGAARDIMRQVKPPRAIFINFPFGHNFGKPFDKKLQVNIIKDIFKALEAIKKPGTLIDLPYDYGENFEFVPGAYRRRKILEFASDLKAHGKGLPEISSEIEKIYGEKWGVAELQVSLPA